jgi:hypothetical protein
MTEKLALLPAQKTTQSAGFSHLAILARAPWVLYKKLPLL